MQINIQIIVEITTNFLLMIAYILTINFAKDDGNGALFAIALLWLWPLVLEGYLSFSALF